MSYENEFATKLVDPSTMVQLQLSAQSFVVIRSREQIRIRCLSGSVWITQEADRNDIILARGDQREVSGSQRVFLNSFNGGMLSIADAVPSPAGTTVRSQPPELRFDITKGEFTLSGGRSGPRGMIPAEYYRRHGQSLVVASTRSE